MPCGLPVRVSWSILIQPGTDVIFSYKEVAIREERWLYRSTVIDLSWPASGIIPCWRTHRRKCEICRREWEGGGWTRASLTCDCSGDCACIMLSLFKALSTSLNFWMMSGRKRYMRGRKCVTPWAPYRLHMDNSTGNVDTDIVCSAEMSKLLKIKIKLINVKRKLLTDMWPFPRRNCNRRGMSQP